MIRLLVWLAGCFTFVYVVNRLGYWREFAALFVTLAAFAWIVGGAFVISRRARTGQGIPPRVPREVADLRAAAERAAAEQRARESGGGKP